MNGLRVALPGDVHRELERLDTTLLVRHRHGRLADLERRKSGVEGRATLFATLHELDDARVADLSGVAVDREVPGVDVDHLVERDVDGRSLKVADVDGDGGDHWGRCAGRKA